MVQKGLDWDSGKLALLQLDAGPWANRLIFRAKIFFIRGLH